MTVVGLAVFAVLLYAAACTWSKGAPDGDRLVTAAAGPPRVTVAGEVLEGTFFGESRHQAVFKGIPYAAPPVGHLRWQPPLNHQPRSGVQPALEYAPACVQPAWNLAFARNIATTFGTDPDLVPALTQTSEDCLFLNVWTATWESTKRKPVMMWIHGGSNVSGAGSEVPYDGANLARKGVVVVTINYRLNVFGFLAHPALSAESPHAASGNYGLLDQIAALKWVRRNIEAFGGDPERVTVFGESAGAIDVGYLMASPLAKGLFHRAISQSGGAAIADFRLLADEEARGSKFADALGVSAGSDVLGALRAVEPGALLHKAMTAFPGGPSFAPNTDGWVLPRPPGLSFEAGKQHEVPLLIGVNADEWTTLRFFTPRYDVESFRAALRAAYSANGDRAVALYPANAPEDLVHATDRWLTDIWFVGPSKLMARWMSTVPSNTYFYVLTRHLPAPGGAKLGAYHAAEMAYVFDNLDDEAWVPRGAYDRELADIIGRYWVQFATTGDPNVEGLPAWPPYNRETDTHLELGDEVGARSGFRREACELFEAMLETRMRAKR